MCYMYCLKNVLRENYLNNIILIDVLKITSLLVNKRNPI